MVHGLKLVVDFLLANTETTMGLSFAFYELIKLNGDIEASLVEVGSRFVITVAHELLRHLLVNSETVDYLLVAPMQLSLHEGVADAGEIVRGLLWLDLHFLVQFLLFLESIAWLDRRRGRPIRQVEKVDVRLHEALREQSDSDVHFVDLLLKLEATVLVLHVVRDATCETNLLGLLTASSVLLKHLRLGGGNEFILLLRLGLLDDLADASVRIHDGLMFHTSFLPSI